MFKGGINGTGIAGSNSAGSMLADIINSPIRVSIQVSELAEVTEGTARDRGGHIEITINSHNVPTPAYSGHLGQMSGLVMPLVHEFSHAHDYIKPSMDRFTSDFVFQTEKWAYDLGARYALEMDRVDGNYNPRGWFTHHSGFSGATLTNYGGWHYNWFLNYLAANSAHY